MKDSSTFFSPDFGAPVFLTFGKGNAETPDELTSYIYAISNDGNWTSGNHVRMGRVHPDTIANRNTWQFLGGISAVEKVSWIKCEEHSMPIYLRCFI